jgi:hypothetical protein
MSQSVSYKERTKTRLSSNAHEAFLLTNRVISQEKISMFKKKMHVAILSSRLIHFSGTLPLH